MGDELSSHPPTLWAEILDFKLKLDLAHPGEVEHLFSEYDRRIDHLGLISKVSRSRIKQMVKEYYRDSVRAAVKDGKLCRGTKEE
jgi:hypothetical protein